MSASSGFLFTFFNPAVAAQYAPVIGQGMVMTVVVSFAVVLTGSLVGLLLAVARALNFRPLVWAVVAFADILRALPPLVILMLLYFGLPALGWPLSAFAVTWLSLSMVLAAYAEESIWAGIASLAPGQMEAARSTGLRWWQAMAWVVLPQAVRRAVPPLTNRIISITKNTALGSVVSLNEILNNAQGASSHAANPTPLMMGALAYVIVFLPVVFFARWLEHGWRIR